MAKFVDLKGQRFGRLIVNEERGRSNHGKVIWLCLCDCGKTVNVVSGDLRSGNTLSCGCLNKERTSIAKTKHGSCGTSEYEIWTQMKRRCTIETHKQYSDYGGRGIKICERWRTFESFFSDMGERPSPRHSIERKDVNGNYSPENCIWATYVEQSRNRRIRKDNKSGTHGVNWNERDQVWYSVISVDKKQIHIGCFKGKDDAIEARKTAEIKYWNKQPS